MGGAPEKREEGILWERESRLRRVPEGIGEHGIFRAPKPRTGYVSIPATEAYKRAEAELFNMLAADGGGGYAGYPLVNVTNGGLSAVEDVDEAASFSDGRTLESAAWAIIYLHSVWSENRRPPLWLSRAAKKIADLADFLLTRQVGSATAETMVDPASSGTVDLTGFVDGDEGWGGFVIWPNGASSWVGWMPVWLAAEAGTALLRAYQVTGALKYRVGYRAAASYILNTKNGDGTFRALKGERSEGSPAGSFTTAGVVWVRDISALRFLAIVEEEDGDYVVTTLDNSVSSSLSVLRADIKAFWVSGMLDQKNGFTASTPYAFYGDLDGSGDAWRYSSTGDYGVIDSIDWACAIYSWFYCYGYDDKLQEIWPWLLSFTANAETATATGARQSTIVNASTGAYDPYKTLATQLRVYDVVNDEALAMNDSSLYDWGAFGLTAALASSIQQWKFGDAKRDGSTPHRVSYMGIDCEQMHRAMIRGKSGLTMQQSHVETLNNNVNSQFYDVTRAAMAGLAYRESPLIFQLSENNR